MKKIKGTGTFSIEISNTNHGIVDSDGVDLSFLKPHVPCVGDFEIVIAFDREIWQESRTLEYPGYDGEEHTVTAASIFLDGKLYKNLPSSTYDELYNTYDNQIHEEPAHFDDDDYDRD
jgi:hypothetical protein